MKIDNIDLLKQWLVNVLNPIFDGDSEKLALYIVALAKKVEDDQSSRDRCINDLEVFLETNTHKFVDSLFETLISKKYLTSQGSSSIAQNPEQSTENNVPKTSANTENNSNNNQNNMVRLNTGGNNNSNNINTDEQGLYNNRRNNNENPNRYTGDQRDQRSQRFNNNNYDDRNRRNNDNNSYSNQRNNNNNNFNKKRLSNRDYDDQSNGRNSGRERHKNRSRNRTHRGADSTSSSSSSSPETSSSTRRFDGERKGRRSKSRSYSRSRSNSPRTRTSSLNNENIVNKKKRCRDFDEKGICTLAEYCPYDHGEVVIAPANPQNTKIQNEENKMNSIQSNQNLSGHHPNISNMPQGPYNPSNSGEMYQYNQNRGGGQGHGRGGMYMNKGMRGGARNQNNIMHNNINNQQGLIFQPNQPPPGHPRFPGNQQNVQDFNSQQDFQQSQMMGGNRPRNLVNIVTSIPDESMNMIPQGINPQEMNNSNNNFQRGQKRSYTNLNAPLNDSNYPYNNNNPSQDFNSNQQLQQQQSSLLPNPPPNVLNQPNNIPSNNIHNQQQQQFNNKPQGFINPHLPNNPNNSNNNGQNNTNTTLVLRKVPIDINRPEIIRQHFIKFGQIMDLQCKYDNLNDACLIRFANNQQAFAAFKSPESILNNRFIRIHWLYHHQKLQIQQQHGQNTNTNQGQEGQNNDEPSFKKHVKERVGFDKNNQDLAINNQHGFIKNKDKENKTTPVVASGLLTKTIYNTNKTDSDNGPQKSDEQITKQEPGGQVLSSNFNSLAIKNQTEKIKYHENLAANKAINDENQKKVLLLKMQVKQKARELIEQQIKDQKLLLKKFEQAKSVEEKSEILSLVKKLSESIEKQKDILNISKTGSFDETQGHSSGENPSPFSFQKNTSHISIPTAPKSVPAPPHSLKLNNLRNQNQKSFLNNQQAFQNAQLLNKPVPSLKNSPTLTPNISGNAFFPKMPTIDNRPKKLIISGVENEQEKEAIVNFVNAIGCQLENSTELEKNETTNLFSFIISFCSRKDGEIALAKCSSSLTSKTISITWFKTEPNTPIKSTLPTIIKIEQQLSLSDQNTQSSSEDIDSMKISKDEIKLEKVINDSSISEKLESEQNNNLVSDSGIVSDKDIVDALFDDNAILN